MTVKYPSDLLHFYAKIMYNELKYVISVTNYNSLYSNMLTVPFLLLPLFWRQNDKAFHALGGPTFFFKITSKSTPHTSRRSGWGVDWCKNYCLCSDRSEILTTRWSNAAQLAHLRTCFDRKSDSIWGSSRSLQRMTRPYYPYAKVKVNFIFL